VKPEKPSNVTHTFIVHLQTISEVLSSEKTLRNALLEIDIATTNTALLDETDVESTVSFVANVAENATQVLKQQRICSSLEIIFVSSFVK